MAHVVTENCRGCRFTDCVATCPVACFHANEVRVYIDPVACIDCSACIPACPVHAIVEDLYLADDQRHWLQINADAAVRYPILASRMLPLEGASAKRKSLGY